MPEGPILPRAIAFADGQNLFYAVKEAFGYPYPNYDISALASHLCAAGLWEEYLISLGHEGPCKGEFLNGDLNEDCGVNLLDLAILAENWMRAVVP